MDVIRDARDKLGLTKRKKVFGLPIGPKQTDWRKAAVWGAGASGGVGSLSYAGKKAFGRRGDDEQDEGSEDAGSAQEPSAEDRPSEDEHGDADSSLVDKGKRLIASSPVGNLLERPKQLMKEGEEAVGTVSSVGKKVSDVSDAVSGEGSTIGKIKGAVAALGDGDSGGQEKKQRLIIQEQIDVAVPRQVAYDRWTDFEDFDEIFRAVQQVDEEDGDGDGDDEQDSEHEQSWQAKILVSTRRWTSTITDQSEPKRIAWTTDGDVDHEGAVTFHELSDELTRIHLEMEYHPTGFVEKFGNLFLTVRHRVRKDLRLFKHHLEMTGGAEPEEGDDDGDEDAEASDEQEQPTSEDAAAEASDGDGDDGGDEADGDAEAVSGSDDATQTSSQRPSGASSRSQRRAGSKGHEKQGASKGSSGKGSSGKGSSARVQPSARSTSPA